MARTSKSSSRPRSTPRKSTPSRSRSSSASKKTAAPKGSATKSTSKASSAARTKSSSAAGKSSTSSRDSFQQRDSSSGQHASSAGKSVVSGMDWLRQNDKQKTDEYGNPLTPQSEQENKNQDSYGNPTGPQDEAQSKQGSGQQGKQPADNKAQTKPANGQQSKPADSKAQAKPANGQQNKPADSKAQAKPANGQKNKPADNKAQTKPANGQQNKSPGDKAQGKPTGESLGKDFSQRMQTLAKENPKELDAILEQAYPGASAEKRAELREAAANGQLDLADNVSFVSPESLNGASAGYNPENGGTVLLNEELRNNPSELNRAYAEETGHHFDRQLSGKDSPGDEGQIFQEGLEKGRALSDKRVQELRGQNDQGKAQVDGRQVAVENREKTERTREERVADYLTQGLSSDDPAKRKQMLERFNEFPLSESVNKPLRQQLRQEMRADNPSQEIQQAYQRSLDEWVADAQIRGGSAGYGQDLAAELRPQLERGETAEAERVLQGLRRGNDSYFPENQRRRDQLVGNLERRIGQVKQENQARDQRNQWMQQQQQEVSGGNAGQSIDRFRDALDPSNGSIRDPKLADDVRGYLDQAGPDAPQQIKDLRTQEIMEGRLRPSQAQGPGQLTGDQIDSYADRIDQSRRDPARQQTEMKLEDTNRELEQQQKQRSDIYGNKEELLNSQRGGSLEMLDARQALPEYKKLLGQENLTPEQSRRMDELGRRVDGYFSDYRTRGNPSYTDMLGQEHKLGQQRNGLQQQLNQGDASTQQLRQQFNQLSPADQAQVGREVAQRRRQRIAGGQELGQTNLSQQQQQLLDQEFNGRSQGGVDRPFMQELKKPTAADQPGMADEVARRMQNGDSRAFQALKDAAQTNPRARQLLDNLGVSTQEQRSIQSYVDQMAKGQDYFNPDSRLEDLMAHRGAARETIVDSMGDYLSNHTSEQVRGYGNTETRDPAALEGFLREQAGKGYDNIDIGERLDQAKLGQARMDLMQTHGDKQRAGYQRVSSALSAGGEQAQRARDLLSSYDGNTGQASSFLERQGGYDTLAALSNNKNAGYDVSSALAAGGEKGAAATQRQWQHLNEHGREVAAQGLERNRQLGQILKDGSVQGLDATVAQSLNAIPKDKVLPYGRMDALRGARTDASRQALNSLAGHKELGQEALESLRDDPAGRDKYFDALRSDDQAVRHNALGTAGYVPGFGDWSNDHKSQYLDSFVQGFNKTTDPAMRQSAAKEIRDKGMSRQMPQQARVEAYGRLLAAGDKLGDGERFKVQGLANELGGVNRSPYSSGPHSGPIADQSRLDDLQRAGNGTENKALTDAVGASNSSELALADARLRHSGKPGLVDRFDSMRQNDPSGYQELLNSGVNRGFGQNQPGLQSFLESNSKNEVPAQVKEVPAELSRRLGSHAEALNQAPNNRSGQMLSDLQRQQEFKTKTDDLYRQRDQLAAQGKDTDAIQEQIDETVSEHENSRFDNRGLEGRTDAVDQLGERYQAINSYADANGLEGQAYDDLLMQSAELQRMGNGQALDRMLQLGEGENGLKPGEVDLMMDMARDMPTKDFNDSIGEAQNADQARQNFDRMAMAEMSAYAAGGPDSLFGAEGRLDSRGERLTDYLVSRGHGGELMYDSQGNGSVMDRMLADGSPDNLAAARHLSDSVVRQTPKNSAVNRAGRFFNEQLDGKPATGKAESARLERDFYRSPSSVGQGEQDLQRRLNADVRMGQTQAELGERVLPGVGVNDAISRLEGMKDKVTTDQKALPDDPSMRPASGRLEASRQSLQTRLDELKAQANQEELKRSQEMLLNGNMDHRAISGMLQNVVDSPGDRVSLDLGVKAGVEVKAPLFGSAEAYIEAGAGAQLEMTEGGRVNVGFRGRVGAGAEAQVGQGNLSAGAGIKGEAYGQLTYSFANIDQASKFISAHMYDVQKKLNMNPSGPRPSYADPVRSTEGGTKFSGEVQVGPIKFQRETRQATRELQQAKPWLYAEKDQRAPTKVEAVNDTWTGQVGTPAGNIALSLDAADQRGDANQVANGTSLTFRVQGNGSISNVTGARKEMVNTVMSAMDKMKPGWRGNLTDDQVRGKLMDTFASNQIKLTGSGGAELTVATPRNLMLGGDGSMANNAGSVFTNWISNQFAENPSDRWHFANARSFKETTLEGGVRARYGTGFVNAFVEGNFKFNYRDATTLLGSPWHARQMLYAKRPGVPFDRAQLREMEKDGLLYRSGKNAGTLNPTALNYQLGRMRSEMMSMYSDPSFRNQNLRLPDGTTMDQERYANNIDTYLSEVARSMEQGLSEVGRPERRFKELVNIGKIREAHEILDRNGMRDQAGALVDQSDAEAYRGYLESIGAIDPSTGWDNLWQLGEEGLQQVVPKPVRGYIR